MSTKATPTDDEQKLESAIDRPKTTYCFTQIDPPFSVEADSLDEAQKAFEKHLKTLTTINKQD